MSNTDTNYGGGQPFLSPSSVPQGPGATEIVQQLQGIVRQMTALVQAINGRVAFGNFTATAGTTTVIANKATTGTSVVQLMPTNTSAATLVKNNGYFITLSAGTGFTVTFGGAAAGTETFNYSTNSAT